MSKDLSDELLRAAYHALRSYQYGNSSPDLAKEIADQIAEWKRNRQANWQEIIPTFQKMLDEGKRDK